MNTELDVAEWAAAGKPTASRHTFQPDTDETPVIFRAERSGKFKGDVTAVFPCDPADYADREMGCFVHVGQHGGCTLGWYRSTRAATPAEYADLKRELESAPYGYRFKVYRRIQRWMDDERRAVLRKMAS